MTKPSTRHTTYKVTGIQAVVLGGDRHEPGDTFQATLAPTFETQMLMGGHLEILVHGTADVPATVDAVESE